MVKKIIILDASKPRSSNAPSDFFKASPYEPKIHIDKILQKRGLLEHIFPKICHFSIHKCACFAFAQKGLSDPFLQPAQSSQLCINKKETYA